MITLIAESFNRHDSTDATMIPPFDAWHLSRSFSMAPARCSASALWCLQTGSGVGTRIPRSRMFVDGGDYLGERVRTRIVSSSWPGYCNARRFDPSANARGHRVGENAVDTVRRVLTEEMAGIDHLIYWGRVGHVRIRRGAENRGTPDKLRRTWVWMLEWLNEYLIPFIDLDSTLVLCHPDHGSARRGLTKTEALHDGFIISNRAIPEIASWGDLRDLIERTVG